MVLTAGALWGTIGLFATLLSDYGVETGVVAFFRLLSASIMLALLFFLIRPWNGIGTAFSLPILLVLIGFGIVPSAMAYIFYYNGIGRITETSRIPVLASVETVVAAVIGLAAFGQSLGATKIAGIALVLVSIAIMNMKAGGLSEG